MSYCDLTDLKNYIPADVIKQLTDDGDTDEIDIEKVSLAISEADDLIDGYLRGRYPVPIQGTPPSLITDVSIKLSTYFLYKRSLMLTLPDPVKDDYQHGMMVLRDIQKGRISPFPETQNPTWFVSNHKQGEVTPVNLATNNFQDYLIRAIPGTARPGTAM